MVCMGFAQDLLVEFSHALKVTDPSDEIAGRPGTYKTFIKNALNTRLQSDARSYAMIQKLLSGTWLQKIRWARCGTNPPRCGDILLQDPGWLTSYQIGHEAWPSCADFNRHPKPAADTLPFDGAGTLLAGDQQTPPDDKAARACTMLDIPIMSGYSGVGLFEIMDRDLSDDLDRDEMEAMWAELEARRVVAEREVWARLHVSQRDLFKWLPVTGPSIGTQETGIHGFEWASPHCETPRECADLRYSTTLRISAWSSWLGEYLRLGQNHHENITTCTTSLDVTQQPVTSCTWHLELQPLSHVHVDGTIEGDCPLQLAGVSDDERMSVWTDASEFVNVCRSTSCVCVSECLSLYFVHLDAGITN